MIQAIRGTKDILPDQVNYWQFLQDAFKKTSELFGYNELRTPIFEKTEVFVRSIGESSDIVNKEMYTFEDKGKDSITLRPEKTAALVRAVIQNSLMGQSNTQRLWYFGPFFRYERPQKGRMRQFHQYGAECLGSPNPEADAEIILLADRIIKNIGIKDYKLLLNTLGTPENRQNYKNELLKYLTGIKEKLSHDSQTRLEHNPLRVLDSKAPEDKEAVENAPKILECLDQQSSEHFEEVKSLISGADLDIVLEPRLVRGLDYYSHTVFEFQSSALGSQDSLGGGGRYDGLFEQFGGKPTPAVGFAMGVERLLIILEAMNNLPEIDNSPDLFVVTTDHAVFTKAQEIAVDLRKDGFKIISDLHRRSIKAQMREANKLGSKFTIVLGENEISSGKVNIKNMGDGSQQEVAFEKLAEVLKA
jgi:histidyl-tRNA synthetase